MTPITAIVLGMVGGTGVGLATSRQWIEELSCHFTRVRRAERAKLQEQVLDLRQQLTLMTSSRDEARGQVQAVKKRALDRENEHLWNLRDIQKRIPVEIPRVIESRIAADLAGDDLPAFLRSQAGY